MTDRLARFAGVYAVANFGAFLCFVPLISLILPQRMTQLALDDTVQALSWALLLGAVVASIANIAAGALSDRELARHGSRMRLIRAGALLTALSFVALSLAGSALCLILSFLAFQLCFNLLFAPLAALATDHVGDGDKGFVFGLLSLALPLAQASIFVLVAADFTGIGGQLAMVALVAALCMVPLLSLPPPPFVARAAMIAPSPRSIAKPSRDFTLAWIARLLIQCAAVAMSSYIFVHLTSLAARNPAIDSAELWIGRFAFFAAVAGALTGLMLGIASDRAQRRRPFLWPTALAVSTGCAVLTLSNDPVLMLAGYALFAFGLAGFLTIDGAMVAQLVGSVPDRAAALGVMNLTNTLSGVIVPAAALALDQTGTPMPTTILFTASAAGSAIAAVLISRIRTIR